MKKTNTNKTKKFLSLALLLTISFNQVSFCMQKKEEVIEIDYTQTTKNMETSMEQGGNLENVCDDVLKEMFEWLEQKDLNNISLCNKNLNKLIKTYMENPAKDSKRHINVNLNLKQEDISFFKKISKNFEEIQHKLEKFIGNSDRESYLRLFGNFSGGKIINLNKNNIANLEQTLLKFFSVNKKNKLICLSNKFENNVKISIPIICLICYGIPTILCMKLDSKNFNYINKIFIWILTCILCSISLCLITKLNPGRYDLSMKDDESYFPLDHLGNAITVDA